MNPLFESENLEVYQDDAGEIKYSYASAPEAMADLYACIVSLTDRIAELEYEPLNLYEERQLFESYILNNRMDNPKEHGMSIDDITKDYADPRLAVGWACWVAANSNGA